MTREEFFRVAESEIECITTRQRNRLMGLVERAWAEGKKNAETERICEMVKCAIEDAQKKIQPVVPQTVPSWPYPYNPVSPIVYDVSKADAPEAHYDGSGEPDVKCTS